MPSPPALLARTSRDQLETLYEARGHEISRLRAELDRQRSEAAAELRASRHTAALATADGQGLQTSLQQAQGLLGTYRSVIRHTCQHIMSHIIIAIGTGTLGRASPLM